MTPEEFDAQVAEWGRRHTALTRKLDAMDELAGRSFDRTTDLIARQQVHEQWSEEMDRRQVQHEQWSQEMDRRQVRTEAVMSRLDATMAKLGETLTAQGGAIALLWTDYLRHKNEHDGGPAQ